VLTDDTMVRAIVCLSSDKCGDSYLCCVECLCVGVKILCLFIRSSCTFGEDINFDVSSTLG